LFLKKPAYTDFSEQRIHPFTNRISAKLGFFLVCLLLSHCGYQMAGSGSLPGGIQTLTVRTLENRTTVTGLEATMTNALITELNRRYKGAMALNGQADATLTGTLLSLSKNTLSRRGEHTTVEQQVSVRVMLTLTHSDGRVLWRKQNLQEDEAYTVDAGDNQGNEGALRLALDQLAQRLAETVVRQLTENF
jgi:outer membrane lipopolysaccharide assembly protein LptE/RlpB